MAFTGNEAEQIPVALAAAWTQNFKREWKAGDPKAHFFGMNIINSILAQPGCVGIRVYYAIDDAGKKQLVVVGADANENDLHGGIIAERSVWCPPFCDPSGSPLSV